MSQAAFYKYLAYYYLKAQHIGEHLCTFELVSFTSAILNPAQTRPVTWTRQQRQFWVFRSTWARSWSLHSWVQSYSAEIWQVFSWTTQLACSISGSSYRFSYYAVKTSVAGRRLAQDFAQERRSYQRCHPSDSTYLEQSYFQSLTKPCWFLDNSNPSHEFLGLTKRFLCPICS